MRQPTETSSKSLCFNKLGKIDLGTSTVNPVGTVPPALCYFPFDLFSLCRCLPLPLPLFAKVTFFAAVPISGLPTWKHVMIGFLGSFVGLDLAFASSGVLAIFNLHFFWKSSLSFTKRPMRCLLALSKVFLHFPSVPIQASQGIAHLSIPSSIMWPSP